MLFFGVCFFLSLIKLSAGKGDLAIIYIFAFRFFVFFCFSIFCLSFVFRFYVFLTGLVKFAYLTYTNILPSLSKFGCMRNIET